MMRHGTLLPIVLLARIFLAAASPFDDAKVNMRIADIVRATLNDSTNLNGLLPLRMTRSLGDSCMPETVNGLSFCSILNPDSDLNPRGPANLNMDRDSHYV